MLFSNSQLLHPKEQWEIDVKGAKLQLNASSIQKKRGDIKVHFDGEKKTVLIPAATCVVISLSGLSANPFVENIGASPLWLTWVEG